MHLLDSKIKLLLHILCLGSFLKPKNHDKYQISRLKILKCLLFIKETQSLQCKEKMEQALDRLERLRDEEAIMLR